MKQLIKSWAKRMVHGAMGTWAGRRTLDYLSLTRKGYMHGRVKEGLRRKVFTGAKVMNGPFKGMEFPDQTWPQLLGSYEDELHGVIEAFCRQPYEQVIDIGSAEGYYATGFAMRIPTARVHAFEADEALTAVCRRMVAANGLAGRVEYHGLCSVGDLKGFDFGKRTLIFSDCDGGELELMDPVKVPGLLQADLLVETHDHLFPGIMAAMRGRFGATHALESFIEQRKEASRYPQLKGLTPFEQEVCLFEDRYVDLPFADEWVCMTRKVK